MTITWCFDRFLKSNQDCLRRVGLFQAPRLTAGHQCIGVASILGFAFVVSHTVTVLVTCATKGFNWGANAWIFDMMGFVAGGLFALLCRKASSTTSAESRKDNIWIIVWSSITACVRVLDVLMLLSVVHLPEIYETPSGAVLCSNIISEILIAVPYTVLALVGSLILVICPEDVTDNTAPLSNVGETSEVEDTHYKRVRIEE